MKITVRFLFTSLMISLISMAIFAKVMDITYEGAVVAEQNKDYTVYKKTDGTVITKYKDREKAVFPDGTVIEFNLKSGLKEILYKDGSRINIDYPEGLRTSISPDGTKETFDYKGKTPYGDEIASIKKIVQQEPVIVELIFNPMISDDLLEGDVSKAFNAVFDALYKRVAAKKYTSKNNLTVEFGYCHFGNFGKCYGISNRLTLTFRSGTKILKSFEVNSVAVKDEKKLAEFTDTVTEYFQKL